MNSDVNIIAMIVKVLYKNYVLCYKTTEIFSSHSNILHLEDFQLF